MDQKTLKGVTKMIKVELTDRQHLILIQLCMDAMGNEDLLDELREAGVGSGDIFEAMTALNDARRSK